MQKTLLLLSLLFIVPAQARDSAPPRPNQSGTWLFAIGGGKHPMEGMLQAAKKAGGPNARVVIIGYPSEIPEDYFKSYSDELKEGGVKDFVPLLHPPKSQVEFATHVDEVRSATAICITGGDQVKAMETIGRPEMTAALTERFNAGMPFITTSAGTALLSEKMLTGVEAKTARGLGLLKGIIVDQHFLKRDREARLKEAMRREGVKHGIGIDEDGSLVIQNLEVARVTGPKSVVFYQMKDGDIERIELKGGEMFHLKEWRKVFPGEKCAIDLLKALTSRRSKIHRADPVFA